MKFKLDENLPIELLTDLHGLDHDADTVQQEGLSGSPDPPILERVQDRVFLTMDKGIADVRAYPPKQYPGLILFRPRTSGRQAVLDFVRQHLPVLLRADLAGHLLVVTERGIRIR
jgi:predicted nuclease of predicted toxin-antitoxin system